MRTTKKAWLTKSEWMHRAGFRWVKRSSADVHRETWAAFFPIRSEPIRPSNQRFMYHSVRRGKSCSRFFLSFLFSLIHIHPQSDFLRGALRRCTTRNRGDKLVSPRRLSRLTRNPKCAGAGSIKSFMTLLKNVLLTHNSRLVIHTGIPRSPRIAGGPRDLAEIPS